MQPIPERGVLTPRDRRPRKAPWRPKRIGRARIVCHERLYFNLFGRQATTPLKVRPFERWLDEDDQPVVRPATLGEEWQPLTCAWLEGRVGMVLILNSEPAWTARPTKEQAAEAEARVVEVGWALPGGGVLTVEQIPVGESLRLSPIDAGLLRLRCRRGSVKVSVALLPR